MRNKLILYTLGVWGLWSCSGNNSKDKLFDNLPASETGVDFVNRSLDRKDFNIFSYRNFYNGGGVAIGDVNNDGLPDLFLTSWIFMSAILGAVMPGVINSISIRV